jgi:predicted  nucleic acid-binding Zn-ribbon protein
VDKVTTLLFSISETDKEIQTLARQKQGIEEEKANLLSSNARTKKKLGELEELHKEKVARHSAEEARLREEEAKILERRKQLGNMDGSKSAKFLERELDIASRTLQSMEQVITQSLQEVEQIFTQLERTKEEASELEMRLQDSSKETEKTLQTLEKDLSKLDANRDKQLEKIDQRLKNLYRRVNSRYPGGAIAMVKGAACRSCFRALPPQLYNQLIAGNMLLQCPGCSRILVLGDDAGKKK